MAKPSVVLATGLVGLVAVGVAVKHFAGSRPEEPVVSPKRVEAVAGTERGGWSARPSGEAGNDDTAPGTAPRASRPRAVNRPGNEPEGSGNVRGEPGAEANGRSGSAAVVGGEGRRGGFASLPRSGDSGSDSIRAGGVAPEVSLPFDDPARLGHDPTLRGGLGGRDVREVAQPADAVAKPKDDTKDENTDPDAPVLDLAFDKSADPNTSPNTAPTPIVSDGVSFQPGEGATFSTNAQYAIPDAGHVSGEAGTISMRIQPQWDGTDTSDASLLALRTDNQWENRLQIFKNGSFLRFLLTPDTGIETNDGYRIDNWQPGEWHDVAVSWGQNPDSGTNEASLYVDGRLVQKQAYDGQLEVNPNNPLLIGSDYKGGVPGANATLSGVTVYKNPLSADRIATLGSGNPH